MMDLGRCGGPIWASVLADEGSTSHATDSPHPSSLRDIAPPISGSHLFSYAICLTIFGNCSDDKYHAYPSRHGSVCARSCRAVNAPHPRSNPKGPPRGVAQLRAIFDSIMREPVRLREIQAR